MIIIPLSIILFGALAYSISRTIINSMNKILGNLGESSDSVQSASSEITRASEELARGATQQAASLEETSASLEEIASQSKLNFHRTHLIIRFVVIQRERLVPVMFLRPIARVDA